MLLTEQDYNTYNENTSQMICCRNAQKTVKKEVISQVFYGLSTLFDVFNTKVNFFLQAIISFKVTNFDL